MCPYARFQSVMFDKDTLTVSYDPRRGEQRGPRKKGADHRAEGLGDCVDCTLCVQVCPTGIDIRDGLQIECIGCAACIDACDSVMDKMDYPRGLIGYTTEHRLEGQASRLLRPRLIGYGLALAAMIVVLAVAIGSRPLAGLDVIKDRALFRENQDGRIENVYTLKLINKAQRDLTFEIAASGLDDLAFTGRRQARVRSGEILSVPVALSNAAENLPAGGNDVRFSIRALEDPGIRAEASSRFIGPSVRHD
jgi:cytochrome c oxidase accessory protein FixG